MRDLYNRTINYLRVSVTDRCNYRCAYCMPPEGLKLTDPSEILSYEELLRIIDVLSRHGVRKVRLTGGEPLVRKGIIDFISQIKSLGSIDDLSLTTNGSMLAAMATDLKKAGLDRVNISLDTVDPDRFRTVTCNGNLDEVLKGLEAALAVGLNPVKINAVLTEAFTEADLAWFIDLVYCNPVAVRFIEYMPIGHSGIGAGLSMSAVKNLLNAACGGRLEPVFNPTRGNGPAKYYQIPKAKGSFGFITPISQHFCSECNRIRLTADGKIRPCLLSNHEYDIKTTLRNGASDRVLAEVLLRSLHEKPVGHNLGNNTGFQRKMSQIGG